MQLMMVRKSSSLKLGYCQVDGFERKWVFLFLFSFSKCPNQINRIHSLREPTVRNASSQRAMLTHANYLARVETTNSVESSFTTKTEIQKLPSLLPLSFYCENPSFESLSLPADTTQAIKLPALEQQKHAKYRILNLVKALNLPFFLQYMWSKVRATC